MTHTHARYTPDVSSSAESGNPRIWNPTTVAIFRMIGTLSKRNPITFCCTALQTALVGLSRIVFCNCRDSDVGIIAEFRINYWTVPEWIRQIQFAFGKIWMQSGLNRQETAMNFFPDHARSTGHHPYTVQTTPDIVMILIRYSRICHNIVTIVI